MTLACKIVATIIIILGMVAMWPFLYFEYFIGGFKPSRRKRRPVRAVIYFGEPGDIQMGKILKVGESVSAVVAFKDKDGKVAPVDGKPVWAVDAPAVVDMVVSEDGMSATFKALDLGAAKLQVSADADLGEGVKTIIGEADITVEAKEAQSVEITFGEVIPEA